MDALLNTYRFPGSFTMVFILIGLYAFKGRASIRMGVFNVCALSAVFPQHGYSRESLPNILDLSTQVFEKALVFRGFFKQILSNRT